MRLNYKLWSDIFQSTICSSLSVIWYHFACMHNDSARFYGATSHDYKYFKLRHLEVNSHARAPCVFEVPAMHSIEKIIIMKSGASQPPSLNSHVDTYETIQRWNIKRRISIVVDATHCCTLRSSNLSFVIQIRLVEREGGRDREGREMESEGEFSSNCFRCVYKAAIICCWSREHAIDAWRSLIYSIDDRWGLCLYNECMRLTSRWLLWRSIRLL